MSVGEGKMRTLTAVERKNKTENDEANKTSIHCLEFRHLI